ncbi:hypothetical protein TNCV_2986201 [Trichonephila clavipes]|nr:hypothetical protein TNCV_2986201 [Trichonephila clavipes]
MGPKCTSRLPEAEAKAMCWLPSITRTLLSGTRVSTHGKHMGDSSPIEAKSIRVAQASEGEPSLPESQRGEEKQEKDKSVEKKKKERGKDH